MNSEIIKFKLDLIPYYWDKAPGATILVDNEIKFNGLITESITVSFSHSLNFGSHQLIIKRFNKTNQQVRFVDGVIESQLLSIKKIIIDDINIRNLIWNNSYNEPDYPEPWATQQRNDGVILEKFVKGETHLGHNSIWRLDFISPFYQFIFDSLS